MQAFAQFFADSGYATSELWGIGYEGDQCDLAVQSDPTPPSGARAARASRTPTPPTCPTCAASSPRCSSSPAPSEVDIVAHSLGVTIAREWIRQDDAARTVRRLVAIDGPNHGIINCSPNPANFYQSPAQGGFTPSSEVCVELGSPDTPFLKLLNKGDDTPGPTQVPGDPQRRHQLRLLLAARRPVLPAGARGGFVRPADRLLAQRHAARRAPARSDRARARSTRSSAARTWASSIRRRRARRRSSS